MTDPTISINGRLFWTHTSGNPRAVQQIDGEVRFDLRPGDAWQNTPSAERTEICSVDKLGAFTVEFDLMVESGLNTSDWLVLGQYHQKDSPTVALEMKGDLLRVVSRDKAVYRKHFEGHLPRDRWVWLKLVIEPGEKGSLRVIRDNVQIAKFSGPLGWPGLKGNWKNGIYRAPSPETLCTRVRYLTITPTP